MSEKIKVLMVDDEAQFRATTSKILTKKGFETTMAGSGEEAIEILKETPHDVVILDIKMPGMGGQEALKHIKKIKKDIQVIMLTGHGSPDSAQESWEEGAFDYLNKPCDVDLLAAKINDAYTIAKKGTVKREEKKARDIMIHIEDYTILNVNDTVRDAILGLKKSFEGFISSGRLMETGHRSLLVHDDNNELVGIVSILDLIAAIRPAYLRAAKPSMADSVQYSPMFWSGLFTAQVKMLAKKKISDVMSESPPSVDENTNLMEVADTMFTQKIRRLLITRNKKVIGIIREQELFFEIANIIL